MTVRTDSTTGVSYDYRNRPIDGRAYFVENSKGYFLILNQCDKAEDAWYHNRFLGDYYAVYKLVKTTSSTGFFQQISPWYYRFGNAVRALNRLSATE